MQLVCFWRVDVNVVLVIITFRDAAHGCMESGRGNAAGKRAVIRLHKRIEGRAEVLIALLKILCSEFRREFQLVVCRGAEAVKSLHEGINAVLSSGLSQNVFGVVTDAEIEPLRQITGSYSSMLGDGCSRQLVDGAVHGRDLHKMKIVLSELPRSITVILHRRKSEQYSL